MLKIEIGDSPKTSRTVNTKNGPATFYQQVGYAHLVDENGVPDLHPRKIILPLAENQPAYMSGTYSIAPQSFMAGPYDKLVLGRIVLVPLAVKR